MSEAKTNETAVDKKTEEIENGVYIHVFRKPYEFEGKEHKELLFDFGKLTGTDMLKVEAEMSANNEYVIAPEYSTSYITKLAARAAGVSSDLIEKAPLVDFSKIRQVTRNFMLGRD